MLGSSNCRCLICASNLPQIHHLKDFFQGKTRNPVKKNHEEKPWNKNISSMFLRAVKADIGSPLRNPSARENFIEHRLPRLPMTDRFDTATFGPHEDPVEFVMNLGFGVVVFPNWIIGSPTHYRIQHGNGLVTWIIRGDPQKRETSNCWGTIFGGSFLGRLVCCYFVS